MQQKSCLLAIPLLLLTLMTTAGANGNRWVDSVSLTLGTDEDSLDADIYRVGMQNRWERTWFNGGAWNVGGYWDAEFAYFHADAGHGENNVLYNISLTPVFRMHVIPRCPAACLLSRMPASAPTCSRKRAWETGIFQRHSSLAR